MPKPYPKKFHDDVVRVTRGRDAGVALDQIAADYGIHPMTLSKQGQILHVQGRLNVGFVQQPIGVAPGTGVRCGSSAIEHVHVVGPTPCSSSFVNDGTRTLRPQQIWSEIRVSSTAAGLARSEEDRCGEPSASRSRESVESIGFVGWSRSRHTMLRLAGIVSSPSSPGRAERRPR